MLQQIMIYKIRSQNRHQATNQQVLRGSLFQPNPGFPKNPPVSPRPPVMAAVPPVNFVGLGDQGRPRDLSACVR